MTDFADEIRKDLIPKEGGDPAEILREQIEAGILTPEQVAQIDIMQLSGSCEILALTVTLAALALFCRSLAGHGCSQVPTAGNDFTAVSMYFNKHAKGVNERPTHLTTLCAAFVLSS